VYLDDVLIVKFKQASGLFLELLELVGELIHILAVAHAHHAGVAGALSNPLHEKLLDGSLGSKQGMGCYIRIAEATTRQVTLYAIGSMQDRTRPQHGLQIDI